MIFIAAAVVSVISYRVYRRAQDPQRTRSFFENLKR